MSIVRLGQASGEGVFLRSPTAVEVRRLLAGLPRMQWDPSPECRAEWLPCHPAATKSQNQQQLPLSGPWFYSLA
jgi:hypothetical protein